MDDIGYVEQWQTKIPLYTGIFLLVVTMLILAFVYNTILQTANFDMPIKMLLYALASFILTSVFLYWNRGIRFLNRISDGKALGALGFFLALIGLTCELYQYIGLSLDQCRWFMNWVGACG